MISLPPVTLTGNQQTVDFGNVSTCCALIANESGYAIRVQVGTTDRWLPAWTADLFPYELGTKSVQLSPTLIASLVNAPSQVVLVTVAEAGERFEGIYPMALTRQTNIGPGIISYAQQLGVLKVPGTTTVSKSFQLSPSAQVIEVAPVGTVINPTAVSITGDQSGVVYYTGNPGGSTTFAILEPQAIDSSVTVSVTGGGGVSNSFGVVARSDTPRFTPILTTFDETIPANGNGGVLVAGVAGQRIFPISWVVGVGTAAAATVGLQDATSLSTLAQISTRIAGPPTAYPLTGNPLLDGHGLQIFNSSGVVSGQITGYLLYVQIAINQSLLGRGGIFLRTPF